VAGVVYLVIRNRRGGGGSQPETGDTATETT
jgi:hypothetical protein